LPSPEFLESRQLLSGNVTTSTALPAPLWAPTDTNVFDAQNGPMANFGTTLVSIYQSYSTDSTPDGVAGSQPQTSASPDLAAQFPTVEFQDGLVGMDIKSLGGNFDQFVSQLTNLGMQVTASSSEYGIVEGYVPPAELPTIARLPQTMSGTPIYIPIVSTAGSGFQAYQGEAYNESETALSADAARSQFELNGSGVTVGVLSNSVNQYDGGLSESYSTGDLDPNNPVTVIEDGPTGFDDEGRAMLENIHDIAPAAKLEFATAYGGELNMAQNIEDLYNAGSKVIVDDVGYSDEPMFQDGLIAQAVDYVTSRGDTYFSAAGNTGPDAGYLSTFRGATGTVPGVGSGTFMNFNPDGGTNLLLPVTTSVDSDAITFEYDQPYGAQEPAGFTAHVTSNMDFYVLDSSGDVIASGTCNNVAMNEPLQMVTVPNPGSYYVAIQLVSGTAPGHVEFASFTQGIGVLAVSQQYGSAGGTSYPSSFGHAAAAATIGVAATPWWAPAPFLGQNPLANEPFSSSGPAYIDLSPKGTPITPQVVQNPAITAPDGGNTSFFQGGPIDTSNPSFPGEPATSTNLVAASQLDLPAFFGTSSAAPNAAAVAALMLQEVPSLSHAQILKALTASALPMNGTPQGTWNPQSGYGLVNADAAINYIAPPTLASTSITVNPSVSSPIFGQQVTLTASVTGSQGTPTGSVDFYDTTTDTDLGTINLIDGQAALTITPPVGGAHVYLETYSGDPKYARNTTYLLLNVTGDSTTTTVVVSPNPGNFDQLVTVTITVVSNGPSSGTPTGTIDVFDDTYDLPLGSLSLVNGSITVPSLFPIGSDTVSYEYTGDVNFLPSSTTQTQETLDSVLVLDPSANSALSLSGSASLSMPGGVTVDSSSSTALSASENAQVTASAIQVAGGVQQSGDATLSPTPITGVPPAFDALAGPPPQFPGTFQGPVDLSGNSSLTIDPGIYSQINVSGTAQLTLNPGIYIIAGGGLSVSGGSVTVATGGPPDPITGNGVLIDNESSDYPNPGGTYGAITISGGTVDLTGPTTSFFEGVAILQPYDNTQPVSLSGSAVVDLNGAPLYAPAAMMSVSGNAQLEEAAVVVDQLQIQNDGSIAGLSAGGSDDIHSQGRLVLVPGGLPASPTVAVVLAPLPPASPPVAVALAPLPPAAERPALSRVSTASRRTVIPLRSASKRRSSVKIHLARETDRPSQKFPTLVDSHVIDDVAASIARRSSARAKKNAI
jgi:hypothetical protein